MSDKVSGDEYILDSEPIVIEGLTDRVYTPKEGQDVVNVVVGVGGGKKLKMTSSGTCDGETVPVSCVVWNPNAEKASGMSDFGNDQYHEMICVEPGILTDKVKLAAGKSASLCQTTTML